MAPAWKKWLKDEKGDWIENPDFIAGSSKEDATTAPNPIPNTTTSNPVPNTTTSNPNTIIPNPGAGGSAPTTSPANKEDPKTIISNPDANNSAPSSGPTIPVATGPAHNEWIRDSTAPDGSGWVKNPAFDPSARSKNATNAGDGAAPAASTAAPAAATTTAGPPQREWLKDSTVPGGWVKNPAFDPATRSAANAGASGSGAPHKKWIKDAQGKWIDNPAFTGGADAAPGRTPLPTSNLRAWERDASLDMAILEQMENVEDGGDQEEQVMVKSVAHKGQALELWRTWDECQMPTALVDMMKKEGFAGPTTIQSAVWPALMQVQDLIGIAKTGSGKTLAFLLPTYIQIHVAELHKTYDARAMSPKAAPFMLCIAPTRELCMQTAEESKRFGDPVKIKSVAVFGGEQNMKGQKWDLANYPQCVIATPGRLRHFLSEMQLLTLENCEVVILDEADRMLDMGFELEIREIVETTKDSRQSLLFSATMMPQVEQLARRFCHAEAVHVQVGSEDPLTGNRDIHQEILFCENQREKVGKMYSKMQELTAQYGETSKYLVFVKSKRGAAALAGSLEYQGMPKYSVLELHSDLPQNTRTCHLQDFKKGRCKVLVGTDVMSRGLDIKDVTAVFNFDPADDAESHVHRIGRTGRAGKKGLAFTLMEPADERYCLRFVVLSMKKCGQAIPEEVARRQR